MSELAKTEEFDLIVQAVKASTAPAEIVAAFNELTALREQAGLRTPSGIMSKRCR